MLTDQLGPMTTTEVATPISEISSPGSDTDDTTDEEIESPPLKAGWCQKKGKFGFHPRYYTLTEDGKVSAAKNDTVTEKKHMFDLGEDTTFESVETKDLIIKGHNNERGGRPVSIILRFRTPEDREEWIEAFDNYLTSQEEDDEEVSILDPLAVADQANRQCDDSLAGASRTCDENLELLCCIS